MLFETPQLDVLETSVLERVEDLKKTLRLRLQHPHPWSDSLRRVQIARAVRASIKIDDFDVTLDDAVAMDLGELPIDIDDHARLVVQGYRDAMTYVGQLAGDDDFYFSNQFLKSLHFMMSKYDVRSRPGRWRAGSTTVLDDDSQIIAYDGPDVFDVPVLMNELAVSLHAPRGVPAIVSAAMAHLNVMMIHPFQGANGRVARCFQTLVLAREGVLSPTFSSVEEYLGTNARAYNDALARVGAGAWAPEGSVRPWMRFMLTAHLRQAQTLEHRVSLTEQVWDRLERLAETRGLPERAVGVLFDASLGHRVRSSTYRAALNETTKELVTEATASRDLRLLVTAGLLVSVGEKRGRHYLATPEVLEVRRVVDSVRVKSPQPDPFL